MINKYSINGTHYYQPKGGICNTTITHVFTVGLIPWVKEFDVNFRPPEKLGLFWTPINERQRLQEPLF